ncbi:Uncharacterised protein [Vibrio cholerae]|nr:Uncharacterised protein [Vibrio cholerae]CSI73632.1 Uncharacterised protein [Vibrio cholerae]
MSAVTGAIAICACVTSLVELIVLLIYHPLKV